MDLNICRWTLAPVARTFKIPAFRTGSFQPAGNAAWSLQSLTSPAFPFQYPFRLSPDKNLYYTGMLVEVKVPDDRPSPLVLGIGTYLGGGHRAIDGVINRTFGKIARYLWAGELELANRPKTGDYATALRFNDTSGFLSKRTDDMVIAQDRLGERQRALGSEDRVLPFPIISAAEYIVYSPKTPHLDEDLNQIGAERHKIGNAIMAMAFCQLENANEMKTDLLEAPRSYYALLLLRPILERSNPYAFAGKLDGLISLEELKELNGSSLKKAMAKIRMAFDVLVDYFEQEGDTATGTYHLFEL